MIKKYYSLCKPGVLYGNVITGAAGFLMASGYFGRFDAWLFVDTIVGMTLVIASACVLNNYFDRDIDAVMERTKNRAIAAGEIAGHSAIIFSAVLWFLGILILAIWVNWLVVGIGIAGFITYVWLYGMLSKRRSVHGTLVGSVSGAAPILAGYCAVSNHIDAGAVLVFLALFFWQLPEFYSIAIYRRREYKAAGIPVISVVKGVKETKRQILFYTIAFVISTLLLTIFGYTGWIYFVIMAGLGAYWIRLGIQGQGTTDSDKWARKMFHFSLIILLSFSLVLALGPILP